MQSPLTYKQKRVLDNIKLYLDAKGEPPTLEELRQNLGFKSVRTVAQYIEALESKGYIVRRRYAWRNIELRNVDGGWGTVNVPVVANVGCDDLSVFAADNEAHDEFLQVDKQIVDEEDGGIVAVRAVGESMADAGIHSGDYVLIRFTDRAETGDRVAAVVGDMVTVKRFERKDGFVILHPENKDPKYKPIVLKRDFKIAGKVLCVIPKLEANPEELVRLEREEYDEE